MSAITETNSIAYCFLYNKYKRLTKNSIKYAVLEVLNITAIRLRKAHLFSFLCSK